MPASCSDMLWAMDEAPDRWQRTYAGHGRIWGDEPSPLARLAVGDLQRRRGTGPAVDLLDIGCGYGRDLAYLRAHLRGRLVGIDPSPAALALARHRLEAGADVELRQAEAWDLHPGRYAVVHSANVYHLLRPARRDDFRRAVAAQLAPGGLLYLSTLSTRDPQHHGRGAPVPGDPESFVDDGYLHFSSADELRREFATVVTVEYLREHAYQETRTDGAGHHHVSWLLVGRSADEGPSAEPPRRSHPDPHRNEEATRS